MTLTHTSNTATDSVSHANDSNAYVQPLTQRFNDRASYKDTPKLDFIENKGCVLKSAAPKQGGRNSAAPPARVGWQSALDD